MGNNGVEVGGALSSDAEADLRREQQAEAVQQLEAEVALIEGKLSGWKESLVAKKAELKVARVEARKDEG